MPRYSDPGRDTQAQRIRELEDELWLANQTIVDLAPASLSAIFRKYYDCQSRKDFVDWKNSLIAAVVDTADEDPAISYVRPRAYCPLCRRGSQGPYEQGFSVPEGMRRHLDGHGNTSECPVTKAAFWLAGHALNERFEAERRDQEAKLLARRQTERLFLISPDQPPRLLEENVWFRSGGARDATGLEAAEQRLLALSFMPETTDNVLAWRYRHEGWTVLADPRPSRSIGFIVFNEAQQGVKRRRGVLKPSTASFAIQDNWKHNILGKFRQRLGEAIKSLEDG